MSELPPEQEMEPASVRATSRRRVLWWLSGGAAVVTLAGLGAARFVRSPAQRVADASPPSRTTLTATVEQRVLADTVVLRGMVSAGTTVEVTPTVTDAQRSVVTAVRVQTGDEFDAGEVLLEVSGRPVFALAGEVPGYRDLRPGMRGADVTQLQQALADLGYPTGDADGEYGPATKSAVAAFYQTLGYDAPTTGDPAALAGAQDAVRQAERALETARDHLDWLKKHPPTPAPGEPDPITEAERQVRFAEEDLAAAQRSQDEIARTTGAMLPLAEVVFLPEFPARVEQSSAYVGLDLTESQGGPLLTVSSGELVVRAQLNPAQGEMLAEGMPVEIYSERLNLRATGEITSIGELAMDPASGNRGHAMVVSTDGEPWDEKFAGSDVRLTVEAATTDGEVLVVPLSAVFATADGQVAVVRVAADGTQQRVRVTPGVSGDGYVAVTPVDGELLPGDQVVVGESGAL
jgi:HlyD family secretion protein